MLGGIELLLTHNEKEALILENALIKQHQPRFNVLLKDDKRFIHLRLAEPVVDSSSGAPRGPQAFPRLEVVRKPRDDGARYFGPYASASSARSTLREVNRFFQLRTCKDHVFRNRVRPCLEYQIKRCPGPCVLDVSAEDYAGQMRDVALFLSGRQRELLGALDERMWQAAEQEDYERAAGLRDQKHAVERSLQSQHVELLGEKQDLDAMAMYREGAEVAVAVLRFRGGSLAASYGYGLKGQEFPDDEVLSGFVRRFYDGGHPVPDRLYLPIKLDDAEPIAEWLGELRAGRLRQRLDGAGADRGGELAPEERRRMTRKVRLHAPQRGGKVKLVTLAKENARQVFEDKLRAQVDQARVLEGLQRRLGLARLPRRIECYDISHMQGSETVASMVVFTDGLPDKKAYRSYRIHSAEGVPDDFASMAEVISRRFRRRAGTETWPDLVIVDGGKGQLSAAVAALSDLGVHDVELVGLAKARTLDQSGAGGRRQRSAERVFVPDADEPIVMPQNSNEVYLISRVRDEAHRFAITHHRKRRQKRTLHSQLDDIPGVGPTTRGKLLRHFGSVRAIAAAGPEALTEVEGVGPALAATIVGALAGGPEASDDA